MIEVKCFVCDILYIPDGEYADNWETHVLYGIELIHICSEECKRKLIECINLFEEYYENKEKTNRGDS